MTPRVATSYACATCGVEGYGAGPCAVCHRIVCYDDVQAINRWWPRGYAWWYCPACAAVERRRVRRIAEVSIGVATGATCGLVVESLWLGLVLMVPLSLGLVGLLRLFVTRTGWQWR